MKKTKKGYSPQILEALRNQHPGLYREVLEPKASKMHNVKVEDTEYGTFDSKHEHFCWHQLLLLQRTGHIRDLKRQVKFYFGDPERDKWVLTDSGRKMYYAADFTYEEKKGDDWVYVVDDAKGIRTKEYKIKRSLMNYFYGIEIRES